MRRVAWIAKPSLFGVLAGLATLSACTNTELALGQNDAANPQAATAPLPARVRLSPSADAPPATPPMPEEHPATQQDMPAGMKMDGEELRPVAPHATHQAGNTGMMMREASKNEATAAPQKATHWTCPMHPNVDLPKPGKCPICGMKLGPESDDAEGVAK
ncbi:MAG: heavy metal-binding domain-containing protein [Polyangiaceae bacterium]